jgi:hypothetical protein
MMLVMLTKRWLKFLKVYVIFSCLLATQVVMAETIPVLRHVQGFQGLGFSAGTTLEMPCFSLDYAYHLARAWHLQFGLGYATGQKANLAIDQVGLQALFAHTFWSHQSNYYTNLLGGCNLAYRWQENIRRRQQQTYFGLGVLVGCGLELYLTNHWVLSLILIPQINCLNTDVLGLFQLLGMLGLQCAY